MKLYVILSVVALAFFAEAQQPENELTNMVDGADRVFDNMVAKIQEIYSEMVVRIEQKLKPSDVNANVVVLTKRNANRIKKILAKTEERIGKKLAQLVKIQGAVDAELRQRMALPTA